MAIRVLIADDHEVVRRGVASLFDGVDIKVVAEASDGKEAVKRSLEKHPDVVLLDIRMPNCDGIEALAQIRKKSPKSRVVMLSTYDNPTYVARSAALGASDYVLKGAPRKRLISAVTRAASGEEAPGDSVMARVQDAMAQTTDNDHPEIPVTSREFQVLRHLALGLSNREIGNSLGISVETVKEHVQNILRKIDVVDRTQAAVWAVKKGLV
jgi:DNA-binding NarL/FixJ family response regulator